MTMPGPYDWSSEEKRRVVMPPDNTVRIRADQCRACGARGLISYFWRYFRNRYSKSDLLVCVSCTARTVKGKEDKWWRPQQGDMTPEVMRVVA